MTCQRPPFTGLLLLLTPILPACTRCTGVPPAAEIATMTKQAFWDARCLKFEDKIHETAFDASGKPLLSMVYSYDVLHADGQVVELAAYDPLGQLIYEYRCKLAGSNEEGEPLVAIQEHNHTSEEQAAYTMTLSQFLAPWELRCTDDCAARAFRRSFVEKDSDHSREVFDILSRGTSRDSPEAVQLNGCSYLCYVVDIKQGDGLHTWYVDASTLLPVKRCFLSPRRERIEFYLYRSQAAHSQAPSAGKEERL